MKKLFLVAIAAVLVLTACKKDEAEPELSNLEMLQAQKWICNAGAKTQGPMVIDLFATDNCEDDDVYDFQSDMNLFINTGTKECYENQEASYTLKYSLSDNEDSLFIETFENSIKLKSLSLEKMVWEIIYTYPDQDDLVINLEYVRFD
jgi:hypothetical protein